jgi:hypothetical protein
MGSWPFADELRASRPARHLKLKSVDGRCSRLTADRTPRAQFPLKLHEAPNLGAVRADVGLDLGGHPADPSQVNAEQLCALLKRRRDRPAEVGVTRFPRPHPRSLAEQTFGNEARTGCPEKRFGAPSNTPSRLASSEARSVDLTTDATCGLY